MELLESFRVFDIAYINNTPSWWQGHISDSSLFIREAHLITPQRYNGELTVAFGRKTLKEHFEDTVGLEPTTWGLQRSSLQSPMLYQLSYAPCTYLIVLLQ